MSKPHLSLSRYPLRHLLRSPPPTPLYRPFSTTPPPLSKPTSSPPPSQPAHIPPQLSHLLKLSSLPPLSPDPTTNSKILHDLHAQLHFLSHLQSVPTSNIAPLSSIRDETPQGLAEAAITVDTLREALESEEQVGRCRRPRRRKAQSERGQREQRQVEKWDVLGTASEKVTVGGGGYFVVRSGKVVAAE
ncbi:hypothetical protein B0T21DRAFT_412829 [Apiosordaria backusii]|uniref:Glutamyl-tRNA amidotransferase complex subunit Gta3 domain-containing protein n=1 Tax=Apiosordaria backusii TaxID=314023 RepID=A0AA40E8Y2_9PEZI|nr:hypothetical protein B0T21DRAFT_412829 [Apiosordaria backusii]